MEFDLEQAREAVAEAVEQGSLRRVAREIGMSPTGLKKFLDGTDPYGPTLRKLVPWWERHALLGRRAPDALTVASAVDVLLADFSDLEQVPMRAELSGVLGRAYSRMEGAEEATSMVLAIRPPGSRVPQPRPRQMAAAPPVAAVTALPSHRHRAPRRRLPVAQRLIAVGGAARAG